jgi:hypothetical protein
MSIQTSLAADQFYGRIGPKQATAEFCAQIPHGLMLANPLG